MRIAVIGPGAMGLLFGARLSQSGHAVYMIGSTPATLEKLSRECIDITWKGVQTQVPVKASLAGDMDCQVDLALLFTKTLASEAALKACGSYVGEKTWMLSLQNGLGNLELISRYVPKERLMLGVTTFSSDLEAPGKIFSSGEGYVKMMAVEPSGQAMAEQVAQALDQAGMNAHIAQDAMAAIWEKAATNAAFNAITGICRIPCGGVGETELGLELAHLVAAEAVGIAQAAGVEARLQPVLDNIDSGLTLHGSHYPSMAQDMMKKKPTEVDFINGAIWRKAQELGLPAPYNESLYRLIKTIEANYHRL